MVNFIEKYEELMKNGVVALSDKKEQFEFYKQLGWKEYICSVFTLGERTKRIYDILKHVNLKEVLEIKIFNKESSGNFGNGYDIFELHYSDHLIRVSIQDWTQMYKYNVYKDDTKLYGFEEVEDLIICLNEVL